MTPEIKRKATYDRMLAAKEEVDRAVEKLARASEELLVSSRDIADMEDRLHLARVAKFNSRVANGISSTLRRTGSALHRAAEEVLKKKPEAKKQPVEKPKQKPVPPLREYLRAVDQADTLASVDDLDALLGDL